MRKCAATVHITDRPHTWHVGAEVLIDINITEVIRLDAGLFQSKIIGIRDASDRD